MATNRGPSYYYFLNACPLETETHRKVVQAKRILYELVTVTAEWSDLKLSHLYSWGKCMSSQIFQKLRVATEKIGTCWWNQMWI